MRPDDLELLAVPGPPALRGRLLLVTLTNPDPATNAYRSSVRRVGLDGDGGRGQAWTRGTRDSSPAISPDGRWVAFLRGGEESGTHPQVHLAPADGGEPVAVTALPLGAGAPVWAPDSRRIAFTARIPEPGRYGTEDGRWPGAPEPDAEAPRRITRFDYRVDDVGFLRDRSSRLFVLDAVCAAEADEVPELRPVTDDRASVSDPVWLPDGKRVLIVAPRDWDASETLHKDLYAVTVSSGEAALAVRCPGDAARPSVDADGTVWFLSEKFTELSLAARNNVLWAATVPEPGADPSTPRAMTDVETVDCDGSAGAPMPLANEVLIGVRHRGAVELRAVPRDAESVPLDDTRMLAGERAVVRSFTVDGRTVAAVIADPHSAGEVVLVTDGAAITLTDFSEPLRDKGIRPAEELAGESADGYPVHGWLVRPEGEGPHPVLLVVHGGPFAAHDWALFDEAQVYASAGYAVVLPNPRGSAGYGQAHGRAILGRLGTDDAADVLATLDAALELPGLDAGRIGVMGGSYGGFMTGWLAAHHGELFRAAWSERAVTAWDSFVGSSDIGWEFAADYVGTDPVKQRYRSPLTYADRIGIPYAVVHSEQDWRCPLEQAQRMFVALRKHGAETEMLLFPGEGHELTRSGKPRHRIQRFEAVLEWWSRHL